MKGQKFRWWLIAGVIVALIIATVAFFKALDHFVPAWRSDGVDPPRPYDPNQGP